MQYTKIQIQTAQPDIILAFLQNYPFESFEETSEGLNAYLPSALLDATTIDGLEDLKRRFNFSYLQEEIAPQNWNALWESNFEPIIIDDFCGIRANFHEPIPNVEQEIIINPKMAFGTGHHETTHMMIQAMRDLEFRDTKVLDYGCGTGILAILAARLGAKEVIGVDIEPPSVENTIENLKINEITGPTIFLGTLEEINDGNYDIILANINRNVILATLPALYEKLNQGGTLIVSGFIREDANLLTEHAKQEGLTTQNKMERNRWICMTFVK